MNLEEAADFIRNGHAHYMPALTIDCVIFGYHNRQLKVLLAKYGFFNGWGLPGGFIKKEERLSDAAHRILQERTSLHKIYLQQFYTFGDNENRIQGWKKESMPPELQAFYDSDSWLNVRTTSVGYYALIDYAKAQLTPDVMYDEFNWVPVSEIPPLLFDHNEMVAKALTILRNHIYLQPIGYNLLPAKFTLPEIQVLYETILNKKLHRRNFPTKLQSLGILVKLDEKRKIGQHRSPYLYKFDKRKYMEAIKQGVVLAF